MKKLSFIALLIGLYYCGSVANDVDEADLDGIRNEIKEMFTAYDDSVRSKGLLGEFDFLDNSDNFFWVPPGYNSALSYDSVRSILTQNAPNFKSVHFQWIDQKINPLSKKIANYTGLVKSEMIDLNDVKTTLFILESGTVIKRDDSWKILSGQSRIKTN
ncbi:MAG: nuclear transport factor 2 family protein [Calditrichaeota bacterium]|nr:nuclear transport factor 2 family protein [Calditrichota bacterium]